MKTLMNSQTGQMVKLRKTRTGRVIDARTGRFIRLLTTKRGHTFAPQLVDPRTNDWYCVTCGATGHFDYILDRVPCGRRNPRLFAAHMATIVADLRTARNTIDLDFGPWNHEPSSTVERADNLPASLLWRL